jgi:two-component system CheB/CheR fusion protein
MRDRQKALVEGTEKANAGRNPGAHIVSIGASAGGLAALKHLFANIPADSGLTFVVVVHLSPEHKSHLAEVLQPHIKMPVLQVTQSLPLEANHVYVIPPNANLEAIDSHLRLSELEDRRIERAPIDHFLRTLSQTHDGDAICVILTGAGSDGTLGLRDVKAKGGLTIVQDPADAEYDGIPQSAISTGIVDQVLPLSRIAPAILEFAKLTPQIPLLSDEEQSESDASRLLQKAFAQLRACTGRDFSRYKRSTITRRIKRRMQLRRTEGFGDYVELLQSEPDEVRMLAEDLLVTVTNFFRDVGVFAALERDVIPRLFEGRTSDADVRVWSVGCATGEEA